MYSSSISLLLLVSLSVAVAHPPQFPIHSSPSPTGATFLTDLDYSPTLLNEYQSLEQDSENSSSYEKPSPTQGDWLNHLVSEGEELISHNADYKGALKRIRLAAALGHERASATTAALLLAADGSLTRDIPAAVSALRRAAERSQPDANALLGVLHASGLADRHGVPKSHDLALDHWLRAAQAGNVYACSALGFRYMYGIGGVEKDCHRAAKFYKRAAHAIGTDARYWPTAHNFAHGEPPLASSLVSVGRTRFSEQSFEKVVRNNAEDVDMFYYYRHSADGGDTDSMTLIGSLLLTGGLGMNADRNEARHHLRRAAAEGHGEAHGLMGHLAMRQSNYTAAMEHFRWSAAQNDRIGHYALGMIFLNALAGEKKDYSKAAMHFGFAARSKHADASFQLAMLHWQGYGVKQDTKMAYQLFENAAKLGNIQSKLNLAMILLDGKHPATESNCPAALRYFKEVAEEGEWGALFDMAVNAFDKGDLYGSLYRHVQAAHAGIELGQFNAAIILEMTKSDAIPELIHWSRDRRIAELHELYGMSGQQGQAESYMRSGNVAYNEKQDYTTAALAYNKSSELNEAEGTFSLAMMYANGIGMNEDRDKAMKYLESLSTKGSSPAVAANLAIIGLQLYWWLGNVQDWWKRLRKLPSVVDETESQPTAESESAASGGQRYASVKNKVGSSIGDDLAIVGGLLLFLIAVLVARSKRMARVSPEGVEYERDNDGDSA